MYGYLIYCLFVLTAIYNESARCEDLDANHDDQNVQCIRGSQLYILEVFHGIEQLMHLPNEQNIQNAAICE